jgi:hypothetical protein
MGMQQTFKHKRLLQIAAALDGNVLAQERCKSVLARPNEDGTDDNNASGKQAGSAEHAITRHGAVADDGTPDTGAIQAAIDMASNAGGGIVIIPRGTFRSGALHLKSNVTLHLDEGAVLLGSTKPLDYGAGRWGDALITGENLENVRIQGKGVVDGADCRNPKGEEGFRGPHGILLADCRDIGIRGVTIRRTGNYAILCRTCRDAEIRDVTIRGGHDGLHAQACKEFVVRGCDVRTGDDGFAGCDNTDFRIVDCRINSSCNGFRLGCVNLLVKGCRIWGPGEYSHQVSKRRNMLSAFVHFAPRDRKPRLPSDNWLIEDVTIDNVGFVYGYNIERGLWQKGQPAKRLHFRNVTATQVERPLRVLGDTKHQFELMLEHVSIALRQDRGDQPVLDVARFGSLELRGVTLQNGGTKPVLRAKDGRMLVLQDVTCRPPNQTPYHVEEVQTIRRP